MIYRGLAIDPGMSTGLCEFTWGDDQPFKPTRLLQFSGGAGSLAKVLKHLDLGVDDDGTLMMTAAEDNKLRNTERHVLNALVVERFTPRSARAGAEFSLTRDSAEPLRCEGVLVGLGVEDHIEWGEPSMQYFMGGVDLKDRKKRAREFLRENGLYLTGSMMGQKDADDAISAELHAIAWLRRKRHMPTLQALFRPS
jgi:hypothetical protein